MNPDLPIHVPNPLPLSGNYDRASPMARRALVAGVLGAHVLAGWGLLQVESVRQAVGEIAPLMVDLIAPPAPPAPPTPPPVPPRVIKTPPPPAPIIVAAPSPAPAPTAFVTPQPPAEPSTPMAEAPAAPAAPPAPPAPPPKTIPATAVQYLDPPAPVYPAASRRLGESGRVLVRVEIDTHGRARQVQLLRSSGSLRLDDAALTAVRGARFKPYTENGEPLVVWTTVPIVFELENS